jgi:hypothetical protein
MRHPSLPLVIVATALAMASSVVPAFARQAAPVPAAAAVCSQIWLGHESDIETYLTSGKIERMEAVPIGVTKPQRATLETGGPVARFAWKALPPQRRSGFMESYKAEIAAYQLDRLLDMHMVPPVVERTVDGKVGAAVLWIEHTKGWDMKKPVHGPEPGWSKQISRMKLFDQLIGNIDRNQGNLLYDDDWHLFLIDHSRAFINKKDLKNLAPLGRVDRKLWEKMLALTPESLEADLGKWVGENERKAMLIRRDLMAKAIDEMVKKRGDSVFY